jgi:hypothetical protein
MQSGEFLCLIKYLFASKRYPAGIIYEIAYLSFNKLNFLSKGVNNKHRMQKKESSLNWIVCQK